MMSYVEMDIVIDCKEEEEEEEELMFMVFPALHQSALTGNEAAPYKNRKGTLSQNIMVACDFDLNFVYVSTGWEGSASDAGVLNSAIQSSFRVSTGKYYLVDGGYANTPNFLTPYRGVWYHLKEQGQMNCRPKDWVPHHVEEGGAQGVRPKKQKGTASIPRMEETMLAYIDLKREQARMKEQASKQYSITSCLEVLVAMDDMPDEIKVLAGDVFKNAENQELFLGMA